MFRIRSLRPRDRLSYVVLTLGPHIPDFELPKPATGTSDQAAGYRGGRVELTELSEVNQLPDRWFGYDSADLVVLNTAPGAETFIERLFADNATATDRAKREALIEWVRRGGRLVITVGGNAGLVVRLPALQELLPYEVNRTQPTRSTNVLALSWSARELSQTSTLSGAIGSRSKHTPSRTCSPRLNGQLAFSYRPGIV